MRRLIALTILVLATGALAGCGSSPTAVRSDAPGTMQGSPQDRADILAEAARYPEFMEDGLYESSEAMAGTPPVDGMLAAIDPVTFWRRIRVAERHFTFVFSDSDTTGRPTEAILTIEKDLTGSFNILAADTSGGFNPPEVVRKPLSERWTRRLLFQRVPHGDDDDDDDDGDRDHDAVVGDTHGGRGRWRLAGASAVQVRSEGNTTEIVSVRIESSGVDTTVTDPLAIILLEDVQRLEPGTEVTLTATTQADDDIVLLLARGRRVRLESNGDNTYSGTFVVPDELGCHHFGVNALSHGTLFDDEAPYDSEAWLVPARPGSFRFGSGLAGRIP